MMIASRILAPVAALAIIWPQAALSEPPSAADLPALVSDEDLDRLRGGFRFSGLDINFGADIRTYVNGDLMLHTVLNWTDDGAETIQSAAAGLTPIDAASLQNGIFSNGNIRMKVGDTPIYLLNDGKTAIGHGTANGVQNMLINTANGFNSIQEVDATLGLSGYQDFNADLMRERLGSALGDALTQGAIAALGN